MTINDLVAYGADTKEGLIRCMNNEAFYLQMVKMSTEDPNFQKLFDAIEAGNLASAFDAAHALKGLTGNLALTPLTDQLCEITELLRVRKEADYAALIVPIRKNYEALKALCTE